MIVVTSSRQEEAWNESPVPSSANHWAGKLADSTVAKQLGSNPGRPDCKTPEERQTSETRRSPGSTPSMRVPPTIDDVTHAPP